MKCSCIILEEQPNDVTEEKQSSGRLYIPHGYGTEKTFKPHVNYQECAYTE